MVELDRPRPELLEYESKPVPGTKPPYPLVIDWKGQVWLWKKGRWNEMYQGDARLYTPLATTTHRFTKTAGASFSKAKLVMMLFGPPPPTEEIGWEVRHKDPKAKHPYSIENLYWDGSEVVLIRVRKLRKKINSLVDDLCRSGQTTSSYWHREANKAAGILSQINASEEQLLAKLNYLEESLKWKDCFFGESAAMMESQEDVLRSFINTAVHELINCFEDKYESQTLHASLNREAGIRSQTTASVYALVRKLKALERIVEHEGFKLTITDARIQQAISDCSLQIPADPFANPKV